MDYCRESERSPTRQSCPLSDSYLESVVPPAVGASDYKPCFVAIQFECFAVVGVLLAVLWILFFYVFVLRG